MFQHTSSNVTIDVIDYDINQSYYNSILKNKIVAWDIETSGLDWKYEHIGTCQLNTPNYKEKIKIVKIDDNIPNNLCKLLENKEITKVFHHAMFDLRFMTYHWNINPKNVVCTKISSKILEKRNKVKHNLVYLLKKHLNIQIKKDQTKSNWFNKFLTEEQKNYAANDVLYLIRLFDVLKAKLISKDLWDLSIHCFNHIPTRVKLEIFEYNDIYTY